MKKTLTMVGALLLAAPGCGQQRGEAQQETEAGEPSSKGASQANAQQQFPPGAAQDADRPTQPAPGAAQSPGTARQQPPGKALQHPSGEAPQYAAEQQPQGAAQQQSPPQGTQANWEAEGKIVKVDDDELEISREGAAPVDFDLRKDTRIRVDGREARVQDLEPGTEIRVRFDLEDDHTIAREVETR